MSPFFGELATRELGNFSQKSDRNLWGSELQFQHVTVIRGKPHRKKHNTEWEIEIFLSTHKIIMKKNLNFSRAIRARLSLLSTRSSSLSRANSSRTVDDELRRKASLQCAFKPHSNKQNENAIQRWALEMSGENWAFSFSKCFFLSRHFSARSLSLAHIKSCCVWPKTPPTIIYIKKKGLFSERRVMRYSNRSKLLCCTKKIREENCWAQH